MTTEAVLGIDVAKQDLHVALLRADGKRKHKRFTNSPAGFGQLADWLAGRGVATVHACLEATGGHEQAVATYLYEAGHVVSVVNPAQVAKYAQSLLSRNKTDRADASVIARFAATQAPEPWAPPPVEVRQLQALIRRLVAVQTMRDEENNRRASPALPDAVAQSITQVQAELEREIARLRREIDTHINNHPHLREQQDLLATIPGIGVATAQRLIAEIGSLMRYPGARQLAAAAGLTPRQHRSGRSVCGPSRLSKTGNAHLRQALYFPAIVAWTHNPVIRTFCDRLRNQGKPKMSVLAAAMRKLLHIVFGVLKHRQPFNPDIPQTA